jgi:macrolide-specific efflux system membrane fusion protein
MYAEVTLTLDRRNSVVTAPVSAIELGNDETSGQVIVVTPENRIEVRKVQLGLQTETKFEVKSGLHEGDFVVTGNRATLKSGQEVRPKVVELPAAPSS